MVDDPARENRRARWQRNKRAARAAAKLVPVELAPEFIAAVNDEYERRVSKDSEVWAYIHPQLYEWTVTARYIGFARWTWLHFTADVWRAIVLLEAEFGPKKVSPTTIARWLSENGRQHGYSANSLRPMVYRARRFIAALESAAMVHPVWRPWQPFDGAH